MKPEDLQEFSKEELIDQLDNHNHKYDDIKATLMLIRDELLHRLEEENKDGEVIGDYSIKKCTRVSFRTSVEDAEELGAVKKARDTKVLRKLHDKGVEVPDTNITEYLSCRKVQKNE